MPQDKRSGKLQSQNEIIINAPVGAVWAIITDIHQLKDINPGIVKVWGRMDRQGETRITEMQAKGRTGTITEKLIEMVPEQKTVWTIVADTSIGITKMLKETRFCLILENINGTSTKLISRVYYKPSYFFAWVVNAILLRVAISKSQMLELESIKRIAEASK